MSVLRFTQAPTSQQKKCAMKMKETNKEEKNDKHVKMLLMEGGHLQGIYEKLVPWISTNFKWMVVDTMKVLFV